MDERNESADENFRLAVWKPQLDFITDARLSRKEYDKSYQNGQVSETHSVTSGTYIILMNISAYLAYISMLGIRYYRRNHCCLLCSINYLSINLRKNKKITNWWNYKKLRISSVKIINIVRRENSKDRVQSTSHNGRYCTLNIGIIYCTDAVEQV